MKAKVLDLEDAIRKVRESNSRAKDPIRFFLPYDHEKLGSLLCLNYKAEVLKRVKVTDYKPLGKETLENFLAVAKWLTMPNKRPGLMLYGNVGTGKTTLLKAICSTINSLCSPSFDEQGRKETLLDDFSCICIVKAKGIISDYSLIKGKYDRECSVQLLAIDELGVEPMESKLYGNVAEPLIDLLCERYDRQLLTIVSTNLDNEEIKKRYGIRLYDRTDEMFTKIPFNGKSYRAK